ncbi:hypothetical protein QTH87_19895 [Variovorax sp. J22P168]|uniref:hypothetical protein n=1 Tax=Variovorax jilinensis TaxID=3053513 RepID=UPI0025772D4D|nr:hypothetical protein [Variovorax sp. J22P168]MDM0014716.1 hypothetical protein [Variovorax sp. J22P168]
MIHTLRPLALAIVFGSFLTACGSPGPSAPAIDNSAIGKPDFRPHVTTYGVVYKLPKEVNDVLDARVYPVLRQDLVRLGLQAEAQLFNIPHVTVVHIHSADPATPMKMLKALPKPPAPIPLTLKTFYTTEAAKDAGRPWWLDLGIVKTGPGFEALMAYNTVTTAAMAPLRDGPLPRVTGPVYAKMGEAGRELVKTVGVSGVNVVKDGKELRSHNPHNTLVYSMVPFTPALQGAMNQEAAKFNAVLPDGINTTFRDVSIVELAFSGNVTREIYRISLVDGTVTDVATGKIVR